MSYFSSNYSPMNILTMKKHPNQNAFPPCSTPSKKSQTTRSGSPETDGRQPAGEEKGTGA
jgi:hypothetical protein